MSTCGVKVAETKGSKMAVVQNIEDLTESFALMNDWEERYSLLIDLGRQLPEFPENEKTEANKIKGCVSQVWMLPAVKDGIFTFQADSDAHLVKGLVALLYVVYNNQPVTVLRDIDVTGLFNRLELGQNLTPNRRNGFFAIVDKIRSFGVS